MKKIAAACLLVCCACTKDGGPDYTAIDFPPGFLWGTATAAHQVEGGNDGNDWWAWEQMPGKIRDGDTSAVAVEHYTRFDDDFALAQAGGQNAHRFSIEWSRIEPQRDVYDTDAIAHYHAVLDALEARGLEPIVTLQHFTLPLWVDDPLDPAGDLDHWLNPETHAEFAEFAGDMAAEYGDQVDRWVTLNEPAVAAVAAQQGQFPPDIGGSFDTMVQMVVGMIRSHALAYDAIHANDATASVGIAQHMVAFHPDDPADPVDIAAAVRLDYVFNRLFLNAVTRGDLDANLDAVISPAEAALPELANRLDWVGLNYYRKYLVVGGLPAPLLGVPQDDPATPHNDLGWSVYPEGMRETLAIAGTYGLPVLVTENGTADEDDDARPSHLVDHLVMMKRAMDDGVPVIGYLHWSLMDNFEWAQGYHARFGLYRVDYATQERVETESARVYSEIAHANALTENVQNRHRTVPE